MLHVFTISFYLYYDSIYVKNMETSGFHLVWSLNMMAKDGGQIYIDNYSLIVLMKGKIWKEML